MLVWAKFIVGGYSVNKIEGCYEIDSLIDECVVKPAALSAFSDSAWVELVWLML